jgi:hypothetical protein
MMRTRAARLFIALVLAVCTRATASGESAMRISLTTEGGIANFPGLHRPVSFALNELPIEPQGELRQLIDAADFFNQPAEPLPPAAGAADYRTYTITVQTPERCHTVRLHDPIADERMRRLIQFVRGIHVTR